MGGLTKYPYPTFVWSHAGGWWRNPPHWKRNTAVAAILAAGAVWFTIRKSSMLEEWNQPGAYAYPVPSMALNRNPNSPHRNS
jgi:hypothetical protein